MANYLFNLLALIWSLVKVIYVLNHELLHWIAFILSGGNPLGAYTVISLYGDLDMGYKGVEGFLYTEETKRWRVAIVAVFPWLIQVPVFFGTVYLQFFTQVAVPEWLSVYAVICVMNADGVKADFDHAYRVIKRQKEEERLDLTRPSREEDADIPGPS